jgi:multidrug efflux pump
MADVVGRLFREFALTLSVTIIISAIVSLTLVPMLCAKLLRHRPPEEMSRVARKSQEWFDRGIAQYGRWLDWVLDRQALTLVVAIVTLALTVFFYIAIPKGFFPVQDTGLIQGVSEAAPSVSFAAMAERQQALAAAILKDPDVVSLSSFIGVDGTNTTLNTGRFLINLKPRNERAISSAVSPARSPRSPASRSICSRCRI